jgi:hypothetical protein
MRRRESNPRPSQSDQLLGAFFGASEVPHGLSPCCKSVAPIGGASARSAVGRSDGCPACDLRWAFPIAISRTAMETDAAGSFPTATHRPLPRPSPPATNDSSVDREKRLRFRQRPITKISVLQRASPRGTTEIRRRVRRMNAEKTQPIVCHAWNRARRYARLCLVSGSLPPVLGFSHGRE